jgi:hypothetical protein
VHNRSPRRFLNDIGWRGFLAFELFVGGMIISPLLHTVFVATLLVQLLVGVPWTSFEADAWMAVHAVILVIGYGGALALMTVGLVRLGQQRLLLHQIALPVYWMLHSVATLRAAHELLVRPFFWAKTEHGKTRMTRTFARTESRHPRRMAPTLAPRDASPAGAVREQP